MLHVFKSDGFVYSGFCNLRRGLFAVVQPGERDRERESSRERKGGITGGSCGWHLHGQNDKSWATKLEAGLCCGEGIRSSDNHHLRITGSGQSSWSNSILKHTRHGTVAGNGAFGTNSISHPASILDPRSPFSSLHSFHSLNRKRRLDFPRFFSLFGTRADDNRHFRF